MLAMGIILYGVIGIMAIAIVIVMEFSTMYNFIDNGSFIIKEDTYNKLEDMVDEDLYLRCLCSVLNWMFGHDSMILAIIETILIVVFAIALWPLTVIIHLMQYFKLKKVFKED